MAALKTIFVQRAGGEIVQANINAKNTRTPATLWKQMLNMAILPVYMSIDDVNIQLVQEGTKKGTI
eukprot:970316-Amphidinium_carterae.5